MKYRIQNFNDGYKVQKLLGGISVMIEGVSVDATITSWYDCTHDGFVALPTSGIPTQLVHTYPTIAHAARAADNFNQRLTSNGYN